MSESMRRELAILVKELSLDIEDLEDMEVLCACTGTACQTRLIW